MSGWEFTINTGNADVDRAQVEAYRQQCAAQGMALQITPLPTGGFHLRAAPQGAPQNAWGQQPQQPQANAWGQQPQQPQANAWGQQPQQPQAQNAWGQAAQPTAQPAYQSSYAASAVAAVNAGDVAAPKDAAADVPMTQQRVAYLRKVYGLLLATAFVAVAAGWASVSLGPTEKFRYAGKIVRVPIVVATMLNTPALMGVAFAVLVGATFVASWTSKVKGLNVAMLLLVGALMGLELAPMVFVAQVYGQFGHSLSADPVRDAGLMVFGVFAGITGYVFVTKKDFSYMKAMLTMGFVIVFIACILAAFVQSEVFSLAVASVGALLAAGFLLYETSYIFRNSEMDDPVDDALGLIVQLRNLFMFLLRIFMSRGD